MQIIEDQELLDAQLSCIGKHASNWLHQKDKYFDLAGNQPKLDYEAQQRMLQARQVRILRMMTILSDYPPSKEMLKAKIAEFTDDSLTENNEIFADYLENRTLEFYNVCSVMTTLLTIEDLSTMEQYTQLMCADVSPIKVSKLVFEIKLPPTEVSPEDFVAPNLDDVVLVPKCSQLASPLPKQFVMALLPHHHEYVDKKDPMRRHVASVEKVTRNSVQFRFSRGTFPGDEVITGQRFLVIIRSRRIPTRYMYRALKLLQDTPSVRRYLFPFPEWLTQMVKQSQIRMDGCAALPNWLEVKPQPIPAPPAEISLLNPSIKDNAEQLQAVQRIVAGPSLQGPYIVFGPPGTGKTTTIVEAILQLRLQHPGSRILVTAGSNSACDSVAIKLCEYFQSNVYLREQLQKQIDYRSDYQLIRLFSRSVTRKGLKSVPPLLLKHSNCSMKTYEHLGVSSIMAYRITVATLSTVGRLVTDGLSKLKFFTHIFIDEAGASTEPETLIGIMGVKQTTNCHVILSGDHKQLGAVIKSNRAASLGLSQSLMERLLRTDLYQLDENGNYDRSLQTRLRQNYRSNPEIVRLFNELYYNRELIAHAPAAEVNMAAYWKLLPNAEFPIIFQATHGKTSRDEQSTSSYNRLEAQVVCWYVKRLLNDGLGRGTKVSQEDIGIVAPYTAQGKLLSQMLNSQGHGNVEVGSVETYQGREKPIIIASLVRSFTNMGFMRNPRRVNVLLSRAKSLLILVGNPVTLRHHRDFQYIIRECKQRGTYLYKKKCNQQQRPDFLPDLEEDGFDATLPYCSDSDDEELTPWFARMPLDISVVKGKGEDQKLQAIHDSPASIRFNIKINTLKSDVKALQAKLSKIPMPSSQKN